MENYDVRYYHRIRSFRFNYNYRFVTGEASVLRDIRLNHEHRQHKYFPYSSFPKNVST